MEFRGDAQYQLGEFLPAAITRENSKPWKDAASSWNQRVVVEQVAARASDFAMLADTSNAEQLQTNVAVHFNSWDSLEKQDFEPVVKAFRELLGGFSCQDCGEYLRVSPERESPESVRCGCGKTNINLSKKKS